MNQPTSSCYRSLTEEISGLINPGSSAEDFFNRETYPTVQDIDIPDADYLQDNVDMPPADDTFPPLPDHDNPPPPDHDDPPPPDHDDPPPPDHDDPSIGGKRGQLPGAARFVETYQGMATIDSLLSLEIIKSISLSFRSAKELRMHAETLPSGPRWLCETLPTEYPTKQPPRVFYRNPIECLQSLLSHPLFESHILFVPRRVWTCTAKICRVYDEWLSGDRAWSMQEALPTGATLLGVVLSSDKTNILVMSSNCMAHLVLISLANIDARLHSKTSLHTYLLLVLLPIAKFTHKTTWVRSLLQDWLVHQALNIVLSPLKTAASVGIMMSDPRGNLHYCFTPLVAWIADTLEESLLVGTGSKASPMTTATAKEFGDAYHHPPRTAENTITAICIVCSQHSPVDYKDFLKAIKQFQLNGVVELCWIGWALSDPSFFLNPEVLHHFHQMFWDHDVQWCISVTGATELDFRFSLIQTLVGYRSFSEGISKLKQVTGCDHRAVQRYIIAAVAGSVPRQFLIAIRTLLDF
ncbi:hypothetical protein SCLCIDRAFT_20320 [Scleroderma citrinum Foug A]|uniref:Uncharacterized protein n=1 Tax=Scleroderma citrinum Foug A TaxID=1036808 RepID=A0A0C3ATX0_9AGAM|nr:hypothetical protein SCLCIDRAFT_20320 [Scleroderma citrinum Foug A]